MKELYAINKEGQMFKKSQTFHKMQLLLEQASTLNKWEEFLDLLEWSENVPTFSQVERTITSKNWWDFRSIAPDFKFATSSDRVKDLIMTMNKGFCNSLKYLGTLEEVESHYGLLPKECIFVCNGASPEQQKKLEEILRGWYILWDILYV